MAIGHTIWAQAQTPTDIALRHIESNTKKWNLSNEDVADLLITDQHISSISNVAHIYFNQRHNGIEVENAILNVSISSDGEVIHTGNRVVPNIASRVNAAIPGITAEQALTKTIQYLELEPVNAFTTKETRNANEIVFNKNEFANRDVYTKLVYVKDENDVYKLSWKVAFDPAGDSNYWLCYIDTKTGELILKKNLLLQCHVPNLSNQHRHSATCTEEAHNNNTKTHLTVNEALAQSAVTNSYRVFPIPVESPIHGNHSIILDPASTFASPSGWHDDGTTQWMIPRGNNTFAFVDRNADGNPDSASPNGGTSLDFDFPFNANNDPSTMKEASAVNLFYVSNIMHDFSYYYGFDEAAGNFQKDNFGNGGEEDDIVMARAQYGADANSTYYNNAEFSTAPDGQPAVMNMAVWDSNYGNGLLQVNEPTSIAGTYNTIQANFGPPITTNPITAEAVVVDDGVYLPLNTDACEETFVNSDDVDGKIAIIDRGGCAFEAKVINAEINGAIAVIVCNYEDSPILMQPNPDVGTPNIPSVMIGSVDCQTIRQYAGSGLEITLVVPTFSGPDFVDGSFDNGVVAHEYTHGITQRLTGGANNVGCLSNPEQMGEGWSDFITLALTAEPGDQSTDSRGIGNYSVRLPIDGKGIRRFPYSTDMIKSPLTFEDVATVSLTPQGEPSPHALGEVWGNMLWDLYWAMVDEYGWDADLYTGTGGNNMTLQLVFEGLKIQPCDPGFVDGRDAIIAADEALFNGVNRCLIYEVFARRGLGYLASQGSNYSHGDGVSSFETFPLCIEELKLSKTVTPLIDAGDNIDVNLHVINHRPMTLTGVVVTDELEPGQTYVDGSANIADVTVNGNLISFTIGDMAYEDELDITYQLATSETIYSNRYWFDDAETDANWFPLPVTEFNFWALSSNNPYEGSSCWFVQDISIESQQILFTVDPILVSGANPALRFWHNFNLEAGLDGGIVEVSTDGGVVYENITDKMIRGGYPTGISYTTFVVPNLMAFSGNSGGYINSIVDLSDYNGQEIHVRFHFASSETGAIGGGWRVDNIEVMNMKNYNSETCVTSDQGDDVCVVADEEGTIIESQEGTYTTSPNPNMQLLVYPNPAEDLINLSLISQVQQEVSISVLTVDGREMMSQSANIGSNFQIFTLNTEGLASGFYFVKVQANNEVLTEKIVIR